jgi:hypothetical protein
MQERTIIRTNVRINKNLKKNMPMRIFISIGMREKTNLTLHPDVKRAALALAKSQGRSLSELVERLLEREIEKISPSNPQFLPNSHSESTATESEFKKSVPRRKKDA